MTTATLDVKTHEFDVEDIEYLRHGDKPLLARALARSDSNSCESRRTKRSNPLRSG
jgi:hypothetical protein